MNTRKIFKKMILKRRKRHLTWLRQFHCSIKDLLYHPAVQQMKDYPHHGRTNCYDHCRHVSYFNYKWCRALNLDCRSAARAGMLHDLFLYDWHTHGKETGEKLHGLTHPAAAFENARKYFKLNHMERDIILNHMWPVTLLHFPRTREGWIIVIADKYCGLLETLRLL